MDYTNIKEKMEKCISVYSEKLSEVRAGRANPAILNKVKIDYYGTPTPINQVAGVSVPEARLIVIQPWDMSILKEIEKAILASDIGINPNNDGKVIRLAFPELTEERRKELVKDIKNLKKTKKKLMEGIVAGMNDAEPLRDKKKKNQQRLLLEIKERIETESDELIELPRMIKKANEELLATGAHYCFERLANGDEQLKILKQEIEELRISLR